ncbi:uncharacterized protein LOC115227873 [Octopus sinensis]|nr:uncharacterized protein LOC115227873 [Octopus sinensis]XP_029654452.1 uncharacterized protein LOC115227873 [Octopus sinensis]
MSSIKSETRSQNTISQSMNAKRKFINSLIKASPAERMVIIGELLYPVIKSLYPEIAKQIIYVMASTFHYSELFHMLNCRYFFDVRMKEALIVIDMCKDFSEPNNVLHQLLTGRQPLNRLLKIRLLVVLQHHCADIADIIINELANLDNSAILHLLQCADCRTMHIDEIRSQIIAYSGKQPYAVKNSLVNINESVEIVDERHLLGEDLFSTLEGDQTSTDDDERITEEISPQIVIQGQGGKIFSELSSVPLTSKVHKKILIKQFFPLIKSLYPRFHHKILTFIEGIDNSELIHMLWCRAFLHLKLDEIHSKMKLSDDSIYCMEESKEFLFSEEETQSFY